MANPKVPAAASTPIFPPAFNLPWVKTDGTLTVSALQVLQTLWAIVAGSGGILDLLALLQPNPGTVEALIEGIATDVADQRVQAASIRWAALYQALRDAQDAPPPPSLVRDSFNGLEPISYREISPSMVQWTPVVEGTTTPGAQTYGVQWGGYAELGPLSLALFHVELSALDVATAGDVQISGVPMAASGDPTQGGWMGTFGDVTLGAGFTQLGSVVEPGASHVALWQSGAGTATPLPVTALSATSAFVGGAVFFH